MKLAVINNSLRMERLVQLNRMKDRLILVEEEELKEADLTTYDGMVWGLKRIGYGCQSGSFRLDEAWFDRLPTGMVLFAGYVDEALHSRFRVCEVLKDERFVDQNAIATAYGVLDWMVQHADAPLKDTSVDVIGYGHCGRQIAALLEGICQKVRVVTTSKRDLRYETIAYKRYRQEEPSAWIIQTAPAEMIDETMVNRWHAKPKILDISSGHIGIHTEAQKKVDLTKASALPDTILTTYATLAYQDAMRRWIDAHLMGRERFVL